MVILDGSKPESVVGEFYGGCCILTKAGHRADRVHVLDNDIGFLVDSLEEAELVLIGVD